MSEYCIGIKRLLKWIIDSEIERGDQKGNENIDSHIGLNPQKHPKMNVNQETLNCSLFDYSMAQFPDAKLWAAVSIFPCFHIVESIQVME